MGAILESGSFLKRQTLQKVKPYVYIIRSIIYETDMDLTKIEDENHLFNSET